ncbi:MAG: UDP-N-acetylmuramoyl-L-alanine--D-glutamate ligase [Phascolarctobacterium sp.]|nr:UDP-N-acetylmuramoyl-L-alanine--D-glutamate ligase [Phascolarctobacterium sp.]
MAYEMKKVIVYGAGISGQGVADVLEHQGWEVKIYTDDMGGFEQLLDGVELLVLSPGVAPDKPEVQLARERGLKVLPEIEIAFNQFKGKMAGITGTNGKTTTTTLVGEMLKTLNVPVKVAGNIGLSLTKELEGLGEDAWVAAELSSFQLETVEKFAPQIACVLNLTPDHLERHHTLEAYYAAKQNICNKQSGEQYTVLNYDDTNLATWSMNLHSQVCYFSQKRDLPEGVCVQNNKFVVRWGGKETTVCAVKDMQIFGSHNVDNVLAAIAVGYLAGCSAENMARVIRNFPGVEHRLEYIRTINDVKYYNDSKATNTDSAVKALQAFPNNKIVLIAGGHDKQTDLGEFMRCVQEHVAELILLGEAKERFAKAAQGLGISNIHIVNDYEAAVSLAHKLAKPAQVVLLSPACSSYDMFKNFEERGKKYKELVMAL